MLKITKGNTDIIVLDDGKTMECTRLLGKLYTLTMQCDGTVGDLGVKVKRVSSIPNDMFKEFAGMQKTQEADDDLS